MAELKAVRLMMVAPKDLSDEEAVLLFVERLIANGLRSWAYAVTDAETGAVLGIYDGYGDPVQPEEDTDAAPPADDSETDSTATDESDAALKALAQSLDNVDEHAAV